MKLAVLITLPPLHPHSPLTPQIRLAAVTRTYATSTFKRLYDHLRNVMIQPGELLEGVRLLVREHAQRHGIAEADADVYFTTVQSNALRASAVGHRDQAAMDELLNHCQHICTLRCACTRLPRASWAARSCAAYSTRRCIHAALSATLSLFAALPHGLLAWVDLIPHLLPWSLSPFLPCLPAASARPCHMAVARRSAAACCALRASTQPAPSHGASPLRNRGACALAAKQLHVARRRNASALPPLLCAGKAVPHADVPFDLSLA